MEVWNPQYPIFESNINACISQLPLCNKQSLIFVAFTTIRLAYDSIGCLRSSGSAHFCWASCTLCLRSAGGGWGEGGRRSRMASLTCLVIGRLLARAYSLGALYLPRASPEQTLKPTRLPALCLHHANVPLSRARPESLQEGQRHCNLRMTFL